MRILILVILIIMGCANNKIAKSPPLGDRGDGFDKQGHRGCRGLMPENTIPAMMHALSLGVTTLELDVVITKDRKVVLSHEPFFNHEITTRPDGSSVSLTEERGLNIYKMNYEEVKKFDVGLKPHPRFPQQQKLAAYKPLLSEVFDNVQTQIKKKRLQQVYYNIETKSIPATDDVFHPRPAEFIELLMAVVKEKGLEEYVIIQSFDFRTLQYLHQSYPSMKTAMLIEDYDKRGIEKQIEALGFQPAIYSPHFSLVSETLINYCHERKLKIIPWTVNSKEEIERLKKMGVDGIITDYPNLF
ncbi:MAG TPA: glycerophosphodiester phosphodiesterase [Lacibacter sp.]|nr:glycerophosphodiester phosphodiesterase [Lacibacter sp.]